MPNYCILSDMQQNAIQSELLHKKVRLQQLINHD